MTLPELRCEFVLRGQDLQPEHVSRTLGMEPSQLWMVGDPIVRGVGRRHSNGWIITVGPDRGLDLQPLAEELMRLVSPSTAQVQQLAREIGILPAIYAPIYFYDELPDLTFPSDVVRWASEIGAAISVDLFDLGDEAEKVGV